MKQDTLSSFFTSRNLIRFLAYPPIAIVSIFLSLILWRLDPPFISDAQGQLQLPFELVAVTGTLGLALILLIEWKFLRKTPLRNQISLVILLLVGTYYLNYISDWAPPRFDYTCYQMGGEAVLQSEDPYKYTDEKYIYPPLTAQVFAEFYIFSNWVREHLGFSAKFKAQLSELKKIQPELDMKYVFNWHLVFYFYQCLQVVWMLLIYLMCSRLLRQLGSSDTFASAAAAALLVLNIPIHRTIGWGQSNLWLLGSMLAAVTFINTLPIVSGLLVALGVHIKLYPIILLPQWVFLRRFRAAMGIIIGVGGILFVQTYWGQDWFLWKKFIDFIPKFPDQLKWFANSSLHTLPAHINRFVHQVFDSNPNSTQRLMDGIKVLTGLGVLGVFVWRFIQRERVARSHHRERTHQQEATALESARMFAHFADALCLMLLVSPVVWVHHYVFAIPIAMLLLSVLGKKNPVLVGVLMLLVFVVPMVSVFPLSYHRLVGLIGMIYVTSPLRLEKQGLTPGLSATPSGS
ncbi:MAG: glycosyltransferase family 87 protein [Planctomycetota bacterium]|jgi:hypothetical protein